MLFTELNRNVIVRVASNGRVGFAGQSTDRRLAILSHAMNAGKIMICASNL